VEALLHQAGVIRAETLEEMFDLAGFLGNQPLPRGRRVAVVTNAGGPGILCADACEAAGLTLPELSEKTRSRLAVFLPSAAGLSNPVDMIASAGADHYRQTVETVLGSAEVDAVIVIYIPTGLAETEAISGALVTAVAAARKAASATRKPVLACLLGIEVTAAQLVCDAECIPSFTFPEGAARALGKAAAYADWRGQPQGNVLEFTDADPAAARAVCKDAAEKRGDGWLSARETQAVLRAMRLPAAPGDVAVNADQAVEIARQVGFPVAVKLASQTLVHKTEIGALRLNLADEAAVRHAFEELRTVLAARNQLDAMEGVLVQPMVSGGVEVMIGVADDPSFGPLIAFGLGGIHVEILGDVCFRITPLTDRDAAEMVRSIRGYRLLKGYRGHPPADTNALEELLQRISRLVEEVPEIRELDLNPVFALAPGEGCRIVDARIRVKPAG
jgi:acyl-CoA synthetase (NDP forming)